MPQRTIHAKRRLIILKLIMDLMRSAHEAYFDHVGQFAPESDYVLMCIAVAIGELENRPLSALKISQIIGMPRATVMRKLVELQNRGLVVRHGHSKYTFGRFAYPLSEHSARLATYQRMIAKASTELSKLSN